MIFSLHHKLVLILLTICFSVFTANAQFESETGTGPYTVEVDSAKKTSILIYPGFGVGLVRNELAPIFYINLGFNHKERYEVNVNTSSIFFFERGDDKTYDIYRNTFLNAEFLLNFSPLNRTIRNWNGIGAGYLVESKGQYFRDATFVVYYKRRMRYLSVLPGLVIGDDFKEVFPVISVKL